MDFIKYVLLLVKVKFHCRKKKWHKNSNDWEKPVLLIQEAILQSRYSPGDGVFWFVVIVPVKNRSNSLVANIMGGFSYYSQKCCIIWCLTLAVKSFILKYNIFPIWSLLFSVSSLCFLLSQLQIRCTFGWVLWPSGFMHPLEKPASHFRALLQDLASNPASC